jgi:hypothetical protein
VPVREPRPAHLGCEQFLTLRTAPRWAGRNTTLGERIVSQGVRVRLRRGVDPGAGWFERMPRRLDREFVKERESTLGGSQPCGVASVDALASLPAEAFLPGAKNVQRGGAFVGGVWEEDQSWRQYAIFMDGTGGCPAKNRLVAHM